MDRRGFLGAILAAAASPAIVKAASLMPIWTRAESGLYVVAEDVVAGSNTLLTIDMITQEALRLLNANLFFMRKVNSEYDDTYTPKLGDVIHIRKPKLYARR